MARVGCDGAESGWERCRCRRVLNDSFWDDGGGCQNMESRSTSLGRLCVVMMDFHFIIDNS